MRGCGDAVEPRRLWLEMGITNFHDAITRLRVAHASATATYLESEVGKVLSYYYWGMSEKVTSESDMTGTDSQAAAILNYEKAE
jgi:hypothetical protein